MSYSFDLFKQHDWRENPQLDSVVEYHRGGFKSSISATLHHQNYQIEKISEVVRSFVDNPSDQRIKKQDRPDDIERKFTDLKNAAANISHLIPIFRRLKADPKHLKILAKAHEGLMQRMQIAILNEIYAIEYPLQILEGDIRLYPQTNLGSVIEKLTGVQMLAPPTDFSPISIDEFCKKFDSYQNSNLKNLLQFRSVLDARAKYIESHLKVFNLLIEESKNSCPELFEIQQIDAKGYLVKKLDLYYYYNKIKSRPIEKLLYLYNAISEHSKNFYKAFESEDIKKLLNSDRKSDFSYPMKVLNLLDPSRKETIVINSPAEMAKIKKLYSDYKSQFEKAREIPSQDAFIVFIKGLTKAKVPLELAAQQIEAKKQIGKKLGEVTVLVIAEQDITKMSLVDVIVNAANSTLYQGGGVCGAIHKAANGGMKAQPGEMGYLEKECLKAYIKQKKIPKDGQPRSMKDVKLADGEAVMTPAGKLPNKAVIHAVGPQIPSGSMPTAKQKKALFDAYLNSFKMANKAGYESIAIPPISTGIFGYPPKEASIVAMEAIQQFVKDTPNPKLKSIQIVMIDKPESQKCRDVIATCK